MPDADRDRQLAAAEDYLEEITATGPVTVLVSWMGDERKEPTVEDAWSGRNPDEEDRRWLDY